MNAMSIAPPMPKTCGGSPDANCVTAPDRGSIRHTFPALPSVTYNAPSGPTVLPEPRPLPNTASGETSGAFGRWVASAATAPRQVITAVTVTTVVNTRTRRMEVPLAVSPTAQTASTDHFNGLAPLVACCVGTSSSWSGGASSVGDTLGQTIPNWVQRGAVTRP